MASTSGSQSHFEAENRHLKKRLEVTEQMYAGLHEEFKKLKTHSLLLEEDVESLKRNQNQNETPNQGLEEVEQMYAKLLDDFDRMKAQNLVLEGEIESLKRMQNQNEGLRNQLEVSEQMNAKLLNDFDKLKTENLVLKGKIESMEKPKFNENQALALTRPEPSRNATSPRRPAERHYNCPSGNGPIVFGNCDEKGEFLELENIAYRPIKIGQFIIKRIVGELNFEVVLPESTKIQPRSKLVLRGRCRGSTTPSLKHQTIFLDEVNHWLSGELMQTFLLDRNGTEMASIVQGLEKILYYNCYSGNGPIVFKNCDVKGEFLELQNISKCTVDLGCFVIRRIIGNLDFEVVVPESTKLRAKSKLVLRARRSCSETPILNSQTLFLDGFTHWLSGELMQTLLLDRRRREIASIIQGLEKPHF
ncbi:unnamed protein product [Caenorhabditis angaria]|uniref:LTD domain-containing protein n=1 Tax=Caenorhabditis angaria TaxID=860376 RepID=A0A9P1I9S9_9PELO|nr:unnamed protein product [Caenorhabditis angaria]